MLVVQRVAAAAAAAAAADAKTADAMAAVERSWLILPCCPFFRLAFPELPPWFAAAADDAREFLCFFSVASANDCVPEGRYATR